MGNAAFLTRCVLLPFAFPLPWPQVSTYNQLGAMLTKLDREFGLTLASRSRIQVSSNDDEQSAAAKGKQRFFRAA